VEVARVDYDAECNWKLLVENHVDVYHLWYLHSRSLSGYAHRRFRWESFGDNWWSLEPLKDPSGAPASLPWISEEERCGIGAHLFFPNLMIVTTGAYLATYDAVPLAPDRTRLTLRVRAQAGTDATPLVGDVRSFLAEDVEACRRLQEATGSPAFGVGPLAASHEEPVRRFHASLRRVLSDALG
jgi:phenylpropionate dioxygenase-like ring-hydroxylating dioxygenase large terminal subunit